MSITGSSSGDAWKTSRSSWTCTNSPQSVGGPRAGETGGGASGSPRCARIFRIGPSSVMKAMSRCRHRNSGTRAETPPPPGLLDLAPPGPHDRQFTLPVGQPRRQRGERPVAALHRRREPLDRRAKFLFLFVELLEFGRHRPALLVQLPHSGEHGVTDAVEREHLVDDGLEHRWKRTLPHAVAAVPAVSRHSRRAAEVAILLPVGVHRRTAAVPVEAT